MRDTAAALNVSEEAIYAELADQRRRERRKEDFRPAEQPLKPAAPRRTYSPAVLTLLELAINSADAAKGIGTLLDPDDLPADDPVSIAINTLAAAAMADEHESAVRNLSAMLEEHTSEELSRALVSHEKYSDVGKAVEDSVNELRRARRQARRSELMNQLRSAADPDERSRLLAEIQKLR